jgi:hypothetical protein
MPFPFYNVSGRYEFRDHFDLLALDRVECLENRQNGAVILFIVAVLLGVLALAVGILSRVMVNRESKWSNELLSHPQTEVVLLNQYCPESSAKLIVPGSPSQS